MNAEPLFRVVDEHAYLNREEEYPRLTLEDAAKRVEGLTGEDAEQVETDFTDNGEWRWEDPESGRTVVLHAEVA